MFMASKILSRRNLSPQNFGPTL